MLCFQSIFGYLWNPSTRYKHSRASATSDLCTGISLWSEVWKCYTHTHIYIYIYNDIYTTSTLQIKGNHRCIYLIYPVVMATGVRYIPSSWQQDSDISHCCGNMAGYIVIIFHFWAIACMTSSLYYTRFTKCIYNLTSECSFNCWFKIFLYLFDVTYTLVVYISYNMGNQDLSDIYAHTLGPAALRLGHTYQANPSCSCYNLYM